MRKLLAVLAMCTLGLAMASAEDGWLTSLDQAQKISAETNKPIFAYFTGSDWCPWCKKLDKEVLGTPAFQEWASQYAVLLKVDFPKQTELAADLKQQNSTLLGKYKVKGLPTMVVLTADGREVARQGYQEGGPVKWLGSLRTKVNAWIAKNPGR